MMITDNEVFVHVPKAGGHSWYKHLDNGTNDARQDRWEKLRMPPHLSAAQISAVMGEEEYEARTSIASVRNPWARLVSMYYYFGQRPELWRRDIPVWHNRLIDFCVEKSRESFGWWLKYSHKYLPPQTTWPGPANVTPQVAWIRDPFTSNFLVDEVVKIEDTGIRFPHENKNLDGVEDWHSMYNVDTRNFVSDVYRDDIYEFGYSFRDEV